MSDENNNNGNEKKTFPWWGWVGAMVILGLVIALIATNFDISISKLVKVSAAENNSGSSSEVTDNNGGNIDINVSASASAGADTDTSCMGDCDPTKVTSTEEVIVTQEVSIDPNVELLLHLGFPGIGWTIPAEAQDWACPQQLAEGDYTYGPYSETKDAETRVWIGIGNKKATMPYTYSFAACENPAEAITQQPFFLGTEKNPVDHKIFNVVFDNEFINREVQFPD